MPGPVPRLRCAARRHPARACRLLRRGAWRLSGLGACRTQEVAVRTVKQSVVLREAEDGEEGEEEGADFGEEDLFHQQVRGAPGDTCVRTPQPRPGSGWRGPRQRPGDRGRRVLKAERLGGGAQSRDLGERPLVPPSLV